MASGVSEASKAQRQRPGVRGQCPGRDSEPDKVIFNVYNKYILCNYWTFFGFFFVLFLCWAEIVRVVGGPRPAPPTVARTLKCSLNDVKPRTCSNWAGLSTQTAISTESVGLIKCKTSKRNLNCTSIYLFLYMYVLRRIICENFNPNRLILAEIWMQI